MVLMMMMMMIVYGSDDDDDDDAMLCGVDFDDDHDHYDGIYKGMTSRSR